MKSSEQQVSLCETPGASLSERVGDVASQETIDWAETQTAESYLSQLKQGPLDV